MNAVLNERKESIATAIVELENLKRQKDAAQEKVNEAKTELLEMTSV
jgi:hypothetical protein